MTLDWTEQLALQLDWHWHAALRPRLTGLTDAEYHWEPVPNCWGVRRQAESRTQKAVGAGEFRFEYADPDPVPPPVTTIAWRLAHIIVGVFGERNANHFQGPPVTYGTFTYAGTAAEALAQLDEAYAVWTAGVKAMTADDLATPCGPAEGHFGKDPMAALILHINRETIHHAAEIALLRDLYRANNR